ncbi:MAG: hypothetical protein ACREDR_02615, partial [Blastocatellia bacterium]
MDNGETNSPLGAHASSVPNASNGPLGAHASGLPSATTLGAHASSLPSSEFANRLEEEITLAGGEWQEPEEYEGAIGRTMFDLPTSKDNTV